MDVRFRTPANFFICGQTQSGKSYLTRRILQNAGELFDPVPTKIIYCYGEYQKEFEELSPSVEMIEGFPDDIGSLTRGHENSLIVLDDLRATACKNRESQVKCKYSNFFLFHQINPFSVPTMEKY
jgi:hypothetical protein